MSIIDQALVNASVAYLSVNLNKENQWLDFNSFVIGFGAIAIYNLLIYICDARGKKE